MLALENHFESSWNCKSIFLHDHTAFHFVIANSLLHIHNFCMFIQLFILLLQNHDCRFIRGGNMASQKLPKDWICTVDKETRQQVYFNRLYPEEKLCRIHFSTDDMKWMTACAELHSSSWRSWYGQLYPFCVCCGNFFDGNHLTGRKHIKALEAWEGENSIFGQTTNKLVKLVSDKRSKIEQKEMTSNDIVTWFSNADPADALSVLAELDHSMYPEMFEERGDFEK